MNIVITGASRGIGKAIAEKFAAAGHTLFLCARDEKRLADTVKMLQEKFPACAIHSRVADLAEKEQAEAFGKWCADIAAPDVLVNNAGGYVPGNIIDEKDGNLEVMLANNLYSAYHLIRAVVKKMIDNGGGHIFNLSSVAGMESYKGGGSYSISKFALAGLSKNLRLELMPHKIKVTTIYPGAVYTDSWGDFDNIDHRIMEAGDLATLVYACTQLSPAAVPEEIVLRPQLGDM